MTGKQYQCVLKLNDNRGACWSTLLCSILFFQHKAGRLKLTDWHATVSPRLPF
jgi:hypothetical protein